VRLRRVAIILPLVAFAFAFAACGGDDGSGSNGGGTDAVVPSRIFSSACCTPSPDTSRVIDGFSLLRAILSISSM